VGAQGHRGRVFATRRKEAEVINWLKVENRRKTKQKTEKDSKQEGHMWWKPPLIGYSQKHKHKIRHILTEWKSIHPPQ
jgi:type II secretory pathway component PulJ